MGYTDIFCSTEVTCGEILYEVSCQKEQILGISIVLPQKDRGVEGRVNGNHG